MRETLPIAAAAAVIALILGSVGMYFFMLADSPNNTAPERTGGPVVGVDGGSEPIGPRENQPAGGDKTSTDLEGQLSDANKSLGRISEENSKLRGERDQALKDKEALESKVIELEGRVSELKEIAAGPNRLLISFGKWAELEEVRSADWEDLGDAYVKMTPLLQAYAKAVAEGKQFDPDQAKELRAQNERLVAHYLKVRGKLPTNGSANGEFTHPINMVNYLAAQLAELGMPLSDDQKKRLSELGEEYDRRWDKLEAEYTDATWELKKLVDEADLKQWFYDEMFKVTTPEQYNAAVPPELQGLIGLDLYSPGLLLQMYMDPLQATDAAELKNSLKDLLVKELAIARETLDGAEYIFDDWLNALQLQPATPLQIAQWRTLTVLNAGKAQLNALQALERDVVVDEEARKRIRNVPAIVVPQLVKQE